MNKYFWLPNVFSLPASVWLSLAWLPGISFPRLSFHCLHALGFTTDHRRTSKALTRELPQVSGPLSSYQRFPKTGIVFQVLGHSDFWDALRNARFKALEHISLFPLWEPGIYLS